MTIRQRARHATPTDATVSWVVAAVAAHVALGVVLRSSSVASTIYTAATVLGAGVVVVRARDVERVAAAVAYVAGAEVLWRMTRTHAFWETGKYASSALLVIAAFRFFPGWRRAIVPAVYLATFVPAAVLTVRHFGVTAAREPISFNASGPLTLAIAVWFFSQMSTTIDRYRVALWAVVPPITAIAAVTLTNTIAARSITFNGESNFTTSGGFGPNQVSAALGFGVLACLLLAATERNARLRLLEVGLAVWLVSQAVLTFARGGVVNVVAAGLVALIVVAARIRRVRRVAIITVLAAIVGLAVVLPVLNNFTDGRLLDRYQDQSLSRRGSIVSDDFRLLREHPLIGVGIGVAPTTRPPDVQSETAHTEFTRLLAEQGALGGIAIVAMVVMAAGALRRARPGVPRAFAAAFLAWSITEMTHSATRIALTSVSFGLAIAAAGLVDADSKTEPATA